MSFRPIAALSAVALLITGCATSTPTNPQDQFLAQIKQHCGKAYAGRVVSSDAADDEMRGKPLIMHVRGCYADRVEIPFHVGTDRSRTWIIRRTADGLQLKHDHRHEDGSADTGTMYGGETAYAGSANSQRFPIDAESIASFRANKLDRSVTNIWGVDHDGKTFAYELRRADRFFRVEFDLTQPMPVPPTPWGW